MKKWLTYDSTRGSYTWVEQKESGFIRLWCLCKCSCLFVSHIKLLLACEGSVQMLSVWEDSVVWETSDTVSYDASELTESLDRCKYRFLSSGMSLYTFLEFLEHPDARTLPPTFFLKPIIQKNMISLSYCKLGKSTSWVKGQNGYFLYRSKQVGWPKKLFLQFIFFNIYKKVCYDDHKNYIMQKVVILMISYLPRCCLTELCIKLFLWHACIGN